MGNVRVRAVDVASESTPLSKGNVDSFGVAHRGFEVGVDHYGGRRIRIHTVALVWEYRHLIPSIGVHVDAGCRRMGG